MAPRGKKDEASQLKEDRYYIYPVRIEESGRRLYAIHSVYGNRPFARAKGQVMPEQYHQRGRWRYGPPTTASSKWLGLPMSQRTIRMQPHRFVEKPAQTTAGSRLPDRRLPRWEAAAPSSRVSKHRRPHTADRSLVRDDPVRDGVDLAYDEAARLPSDGDRHNEFVWKVGDQGDEEAGGGLVEDMADIVREEPAFSVRHVASRGARRKGRRRIVWTELDEADIRSLPPDVQDNVYTLEELEDMMGEAGVDWELVVGHSEDDVVSLADSWMETDGAR